MELVQLQMVGGGSIHSKVSKLNALLLLLRCLINTKHVKEEED